MTRTLHGGHHIILVNDCEVINNCLLVQDLPVNYFLGQK